MPKTLSVTNVSLKDVEGQIATMYIGTHEAGKHCTKGGSGKQYLKECD